MAGNQAGQQGVAQRGEGLRLIRVNPEPEIGHSMIEGELQRLRGIQDEVAWELLQRDAIDRGTLDGLFRQQLLKWHCHELVKQKMTTAVDCGRSNQRQSSTQTASHTWWNEGEKPQCFLLAEHNVAGARRYPSSPLRPVAFIDDCLLRVADGS